MWKKKNKIHRLKTRIITKLKGILQRYLKEFKLMNLQSGQANWQEIIFTKGSALSNSSKCNIKGLQQIVEGIICSSCWEIINKEGQIWLKDWFNNLLLSKKRHHFLKH